MCEFSRVRGLFLLFYSVSGDDTVALFSQLTFQLRPTLIQRTQGTMTVVLDHYFSFSSILRTVKASRSHELSLERTNRQGNFVFLRFVIER